MPIHRTDEFNKGAGGASAIKDERARAKRRRHLQFYLVSMPFLW
jgi:hypothetical protein